MVDLNFRQFKIRYFILTYILLTVLTVVLGISFGGSQFMSDVMQLVLSVAIMLYLLWQMRSKNITYNMASLSGPMSKKRWAKYVGATIATKLYAQLVVMFFGLVVVVLLFDVIQLMLDVVGDMPVVVVDASVFHYVATFITICILAPIWEELFFRGIVLRRLLMKWGAPASIIVSSIIFGLFHLNPGQILYATILGVLLAYVYLRTGNIVVPMILHSVANFVSFIALVQVGGQSNEGVITELMNIKKEELLPLLWSVGGISLVLTVVLVVVVAKKYRHVKAIPKLEYRAVEEK